MKDGADNQQADLQAQFDRWAPSYDREVGAESDGFPFAGYALALETILARAEAQSGMTVLDLGVGTGNLARLFVESGCRVVGADFSAEMLRLTAEKLPQLELVQVDLTAEEWPEVMNGRFDRVVSNYVFHEFPFETKLRLLDRLAGQHLAPGGRIVIGDVSFADTAELERARAAYPDEWEEEYFWTADRAQEALRAAGWGVEVIQLSFCAAVYVLTPPAGQITKT